jgi:hypothetical protein
MRFPVRWIPKSARVTLLLALLCGGCIFPDPTETVEEFGNINVEYLGFPSASGFTGSGTLRGPNNTNLTFNGATTFLNVLIGPWTATIDDVNRGGHDWKPIDMELNFEVLARQTLQLSVGYSRQTASYKFIADNIPSGTGDFGTGSIGGTTFQISSTPYDRVVLPGLLEVTYKTQDPNGFNSVPQETSRSFTLSAGFDLTDRVRFSPTRFELVVESQGLPTGATFPLTIQGNGMTYSPMGPGAWFYDAGTGFSMSVPSMLTVTNTQALRMELYRPMLAGYSFNGMAGETLTLAVEWSLDSYTARQQMNWAVKIDQQGHHIHLSGFRVNFTDFKVDEQMQAPPAASGAKVPRPIVITGPPGWITLTGSLEDDGTFTASGSGVAAGFSNVPVTFTGAITTAGVLNAELVLGSDTPPTGLPGGSITYTVTGMRLVASAER